MLIRSADEAIGAGQYTDAAAILRLYDRLVYGENSPPQWARYDAISCDLLGQGVLAEKAGDTMQAARKYRQVLQLNSRRLP